jgi:hypothetical protein|tara:strand:+ start:312 stop:827 length:516 start_codon:yes stop_codon:yes gene_type:complete
MKKYEPFKMKGHELPGPNQRSSSPVKNVDADPNSYIDESGRRVYGDAHANIGIEGTSEGIRGSGSNWREAQYSDTSPMAGRSYRKIRSGDVDIDKLIDASAGADNVVTKTQAGIGAIPVDPVQSDFVPEGTQTGGALMDRSDDYSHHRLGKSAMEKKENVDVEVTVNGKKI